jgi:stage V sporulation protein SpoVS
MATFSDDTSEDTIRELRVAGGTPPKELAGSIIHLLQDGKRVRLAAIGHQAVGQAVKAIPVVNAFAITQGYVVALMPYFALKSVPNRDAEEEPVPVGIDVRVDRLQERTITMMSLIMVSPQ